MSTKSKHSKNKKISMNTSNKLVQAIQLQNQGKVAEAEAAFREILSASPADGAALYSLAVILLNSGRTEEAVKLTSNGVQLAPTFAPLRFVHGAILQALSDFPAALASFDEALKLKPDYVEVWLNSGVLLRNMHRHKESLERFNHVLTLDPGHVSALANCGILLTEFKQSEQAIKMFEHLLKLKPDYDFGLGLLEYERLHICDWTDFDVMSEKIITGIRSGKRTCKTLALMAISDSASDHFEAAKIFSEFYCPPSTTKLWKGERYKHDKIRIAYVSPDLREHPVGHLMAGIFELHDKSRFETIAISLGIDDGGRLRARMLKAFDRFIDVREMSSLKVAQLMRDLQIDIAIDLGGYTSDTRTDVFSFRPCPVQVNYLGYPGTMGVDYYDYILADQTIIPPDQQQFYSEKVAYLPDTYLPTDSSVKISERTPTRAECGLPETGFVFCSFSHDYKISLHVFDIWMRLLQQVPGSVLWMMSRNETSIRNLRREAEKRGVEGARLIFAGRVPLVEDHLARYRQADLFLDTHPYNAHTTSADALMAGLPVLTYMGNSFPSRVAASLLHAIGVPELVTHSHEEYESLALTLAQHPNLLGDLKAKIVENKPHSSLFNTKKFCENLEAAYTEMWRSIPYSEIVEAGSNITNVITPPKKLMTKTLDLGCGPNPKNPFNADEVFGIDVREDLDAGIKRADLIIEPIPFEDASFEYVTAHDFLEHVPRVIYVPHRRNAFVEVMNEVYRVLKVGGLFLSFTPAYPNPEAFRDPTHVNIITDQTFQAYFDNVNRWASGYGFNGAFVIKLQEWRGPHLLTVLQKVEWPQQ